MCQEKSKVVITGRYEPQIFRTPESVEHDFAYSDNNWVKVDKGSEVKDLFWIAPTEEVITPSRMKTLVEGPNGQKYRLLRNEGTWICDCKGFTFRRKCKHTAERIELDKKTEASNESND